MPQKYGQLAAKKSRVEEIVMSVDEETLFVTWRTDHTGFKDRMAQWIDLVAKSAGTEAFDVAQFLEDLFGKTNDV